MPMRIYIPDNPTTKQKLDRDSVPAEVQIRLLGLEHDARPDGFGAVVQVYFNGKLGEWHLAADCFEAVETMKD